jgi:hypothetical protein
MELAGRNQLSRSPNDYPEPGTLWRNRIGGQSKRFRDRPMSHLLAWVLTSFRSERVLFRPGGVNLRARLCGVPNTRCAHVGARHSRPRLDAYSSRPIFCEGACTPPRNPSISLPGRKMPPFRIGNCQCLIKRFLVFIRKGSFSESETASLL